MNAEQILKEEWGDSYIAPGIYIVMINAMNRYGKQQYNLALDKAAEKIEDWSDDYTLQSVLSL